MQLASPWLADYVWHRQPFDLRPALFARVPCLCGTTAMGDSLDDEWLIVAVLVHISRQLPDIVLRYGHACVRSRARGHALRRPYQRRRGSA
jgi:hypothetical protein